MTGEKRRRNGRLCSLFLSLLFAALLCSLPSHSAGDPRSASEKDVPTLFHNDEAWYKDGVAPALMKGGILHAPGDVFAMLDGVTFTVEGENLLFINENTGDYVSVLYSDQAACVNGRVTEHVSIFREGGYYYLDAAFLAESLGFTVEYAPSPAMALRINDGTQKMAFDDLLSLYTETDDDAHAPPTSSVDEDFSPTQIYLICRDSAETSYVFAKSMADRYGFGYSLFLTPDSEITTHLSRTEETGLSVSSVSEADELNERLSAVYRQKSHLVLATGEDAVDHALTEAGYYVLTPDFTVSLSTDAQQMFLDIVRRAALEEYAVVLLDDVWQSETLLQYLDTLDKEFYHIGRIDGVYGVEPTEE